MTVWEIVILMIVGTICLAGGIGFVYASIVNTVERYQIRRTNREMETFTKIMGIIPDIFVQVFNKLKELEEKKINI